MRKMKKINGYLVVKFNARELREYEGTALGEYGVIDAELYTGVLDIDRGAMEYDNAGSMEEAVELARGLESELDAEEPEVKVTIVKETDETTEEEGVDAQQMIAGWENTLRGQVASPHYNDVDARTAAHELYGYKAALRDLGLLTREDCFVLPDTFGAWPSPLPRRPEELLSYVCDELCRRRLPEMTQEQLDAVCARCSLERLANEADEAELRIRAGAHRELNGLIDQIRRAESRTQAEQVGAEARAYAAMLLMKADTALVRNQGITKFGTLYTDYELCHYVGKHVGIKWDIDDVTKLYVFDEEGRKICEAVSAELLAFGPHCSQAALERHLRDQKRQEKEMREILEDMRRPYELRVQEGGRPSSAVGMIDLTIKAERSPKVIALPNDKEYRAEAAASRKAGKKTSGDEFLTNKADDALARLRAMNE